MDIKEVKNFVETMDSIVPGAFVLDEENGILGINYNDEEVQIDIEELSNISMEPRKRYGVYLTFSAALPDDPSYTRFVIMKIAKNRFQKLYIFLEYIFKKFWYSYGSWVSYIALFFAGFFVKSFIS